MCWNQGKHATGDVGTIFNHSSKLKKIAKTNALSMGLSENRVPHSIQRLARAFESLSFFRRAQIIYVGICWPITTRKSVNPTIISGYSFNPTLLRPLTSTLHRHGIWSVVYPLRSHRYGREENSSSMRVGKEREPGSEESREVKK